MTRAEAAAAGLLAGIAVAAGVIAGILDLCARGQEAADLDDGPVEGDETVTLYLD